MDEVRSVGVVGAGTMGNGIAHVLALSGYETILIDHEQRVLDQAITTIRTNLERQRKKEIVTAEQVHNTQERIKTNTTLESVKHCQVVIEAIIEKTDLKRKLFSELSAIVDKECCLASNTSTISITEIASAAKYPGKVIGMHFMNPVPMMKLVEVVRGLQTSDETYFTIKHVAEQMGKVPVLVKDSPGFISNRILMPMINEAILSLEEGIAEPEAIDTIMKLGMSHPMGPLELADLIGLDVCLSIMKVLHQDFGDSKYRPAPLLTRMVAAGYLGRKSRRGFYSYQ